MRSLRSLLIIVLTCGSAALRAEPAEEVAEEPSVSEFELVTGFHRVIHKSLASTCGSSRLMDPRVLRGIPFRYSSW